MSEPCSKVPTAADDRSGCLADPRGIHHDRVDEPNGLPWAGPEFDWHRPVKRTLPVRVDPLPGEALESWLAALATRMNATWGEVLDAVLPTGANGTARSPPRSGADHRGERRRAGQHFRRDRESAVATSTT